MSTDSILHESATIILVAVAALLSLGALALCGCIVFWAMRDARHALDVVVRHQDSAAAFYKKAVAESVAKGKTNMAIRPLQDEGEPSNPVLGQVDGLIDGMTDEDIG